MMPAILLPDLAGGGGIGIPGAAKAFTNNPSFVTLNPSKQYCNSGLKIFRFMALARAFDGLGARYWQKRQDIFTVFIPGGPERFAPFRD
jgi:hypothetical protein